MSRADVLRQMADEYGKHWTADDFSSPNTRPWETKWENRASYVRADMVREGLLADSADGNWVLTPAGWAAAKNLPPETKLFESHELERREVMWRSIIRAGGPADVKPAFLNEIGMYRGGRGIYANQEVTRTATFPHGVAISFLHTGTSYDDELTETGVVYHFPETRGIGRDKAEIESCRAAYMASVPVFVITPGANREVRRVHRGYIEEVDDYLGTLLITFTDGEMPPPPLPDAEEDDEFSLVEGGRDAKYSRRRNRPNQMRFAFKVFRRYGPACVACGLEIKGLVQAAHLHAKKLLGSDDPRNGIPLCANHHIAFDKGLWAIDPDTTQFVIRSEGPAKDELGLLMEDLTHLKKLPHPDALSAAWKTWQKSRRKK